MFLTSPLIDQAVALTENWPTPDRVEKCNRDLSAATVERDAIRLAFLCWRLTNVTRFSRSGSRIYCQRKHFPFVCPL